MTEIAINLIPLRTSITAEAFADFSRRLDQPALLAQDVVQRLDVYAVRSRSPGAPAIDVVEVMQVRSWDEWEKVRDGLPGLAPVVQRFSELVDPATVSTIFGTPIAPSG